MRVKGQHPMAKDAQHVLVPTLLSHTAAGSTPPLSAGSRPHSSGLMELCTFEQPHSKPVESLALIK